MDLIIIVNFGFILREVYFREYLRLYIQGIVVVLEFVFVVSNEESSWQLFGEISCYQCCEICYSDKIIREFIFIGQYGLQKIIILFISFFILFCLVFDLNLL